MSKNKLSEKEIIALFDKIEATEGPTVKIVVENELISVDKKNLIIEAKKMYFDLKRDELLSLIKTTGIKKGVLAVRLGITSVRFSQIITGVSNSVGGRLAIDIINEGIELLKNFGTCSNCGREYCNC